MWPLCQDVIFIVHLDLIFEGPWNNCGTLMLTNEMIPKERKHLIVKSKSSRCKIDFSLPAFLHSSMFS